MFAARFRERCNIRAGVAEATPALVRICLSTRLLEKRMLTSLQAGPSSSPARARVSASGIARVFGRARRARSRRLPPSRRSRSDGEGDRRRQASAFAADVSDGRDGSDGRGSASSAMAASTCSAPMPASFPQAKLEEMTADRLGRGDRHQPQGHVPFGHRLRSRR